MTRKFLFAMLAVMVVAAPAAAGPLFSFNTGTDVGVDGVDDSWTLAGGTAYIRLPGYPLGGGDWLPNSPESRWISPQQTGDGASNTTFAFEYAFTLASGIDPSLVRLAGRFASDNQSRILLNGVAITTLLDSCLDSTTDTSCFRTWHNFSVLSGFVAGSNTLTFEVLNGEGPVGLRVEGEGSSVVPEPGTLLLIGSGLTGLALRRRRRA